MNRFHTVLFTSLILTLSSYAELSSHFFPTKQEIAKFTPPKNLQIPFKLFRYSLDKVPESQVIISTLNFANGTTKVSPEKAKRLSKSFYQTYQEIEQDPEFKTISSTLAYSYSQKPFKRGHYYLYQPAKVDAETPTIIFLHGFGGNFLFYLKIMKEEFPNHRIIFPTYSYSWFKGNTAYLAEVLRDVEKRTKVKVRSPWLFALSAGGPAAVKIYNKNPKYFKALIMITSFFRTTKVEELRKDLKIFMLCGRKDERIKFTSLEKKIKQFQKSLPQLKYDTINSDHFLMLTDQEECFSKIKTYMNSQ